MTDQASTAEAAPAPRPRFWRRAWNWTKALWLRVWSAIQPGPTAKRGASWAWLAVALVAGSFALIDFRAGFGPILDPPAAVLLAIVFLAVVFVMVALSARLVSLVRRFLTWTGIGLLGAAIFGLMAWGLPEAGGAGALITAAVLLGEALLGGALALIIAGGLRTGPLPKRIWLGFVVCATLVGNVWMIYWLAQRGSGTDLVRPEPDKAAVAPLNLGDPSKPGPFKVLRTTYGSGTDHRRPEFGANVGLKTRSVDGRPFVRGSKGWRMTLRQWFWWVDFEHFPVNGRVWYPDGPGPFPLVLIVHGNHGMEEFSDPGYAYLGEHLASRGFIFVSVDENFFNSSLRGSLSKENDARGWMLLQHLKVWTQWNGAAGNPFTGKVALDRIAIIGHSRGGEAVAVAGAFNRLRYYPDDGRIEMPSGFGIRSIVAIAPVDGQYSSGGRPTPLENVNYLTLQGAHDSDVSTFHGIRQWARVRFTDGAEHVKAAVYIYRANHGQFNTVWGDSDVGFPRTLLLDRNSLLAGDDQRRAAKVFITSFLEATLADKRDYLAVLQDERRARAWLPNDLYVTRYADSSVRTIADFEEDLDLTTTRLTGGKVEAQGLAMWREQYLPFKNGDTHDTVAYLGWKEPKKGSKAPAVPASYAISLPADAVAGWALTADSELRFALAQVDEQPKDLDEEDGDSGSKAAQDAKKKAEDDKKKAEEDKKKKEQEKKSDPNKPERLDLSLELTSTNGAVVRLPLSRFRAIPVVLKSRMTKLPNEDSLFSKRAEPVLQSFAIPLSAFAEADARFDPATLSSIRFVFDKSKKGVVAVDDLGVK